MRARTLHAEVRQRSLTSHAQSEPRSKLLGSAQGVLTAVGMSFPQEGELAAQNNSSNSCTETQSPCYIGSTILSVPILEAFASGKMYSTTGRGSQNTTIDVPPMPTVLQWALAVNFSIKPKTLNLGHCKSPTLRVEIPDP